MTTTRRSLEFPIAILAMFVLEQLSVSAVPAVPRVRALETLRVSNPQLRLALDHGLALSSTLRELEAHLARSSTIVYLSRTTLPRGLVGRTRLIGAGDRWRFLSVELDERVGMPDLLAVLGHELQHAVEIADAAEVVDANSLLALYRRIGQEAPNRETAMHSFETREAVEVGRRVQAELARWTGNAAW